MLLRIRVLRGRIDAVTAQGVLHGFRHAAEWCHDVLTQAERDALTPQVPMNLSARLADVDELILAALVDDARASAALLAARTVLPDSTVRRRIASLADRGQLRTNAVIDPRRLGLNVDANLWLQVPPGRLDSVGRTLAAHPAVHGALATTGPANVQVAIWVRDLSDLY